VGRVAQVGQQAPLTALLLVDSRHPGLASDFEAWTWLQGVVGSLGIAATKIDKLARGERIRALRELQSVFDTPVVPVSAATGEGLDELWKLIDTLNNSHQTPRNRSRERPPAPAAKNPPLANAHPRNPPTGRNERSARNGPQTSPRNARPIATESGRRSAAARGARTEAPRKKNRQRR
jgi:predicted GTPase